MNKEERVVWLREYLNKCLKRRAPELAEELSAAEEMRKILPLCGLPHFDPADDPDTLLGDRWLGRGGVGLIVGPTGVGKSSFLMQCLLNWAIGRPAFGIVPKRPLTSVLVQAENDLGDISEMRDGVLRGMVFSSDEQQASLSNVFLACEATKTGDPLFVWLEEICKHFVPDLLVLDPVFAYLGGDASEQKAVSGFLRNKLMPMAAAHRIGVILAHHTNKPPRQVDGKSQWKAGDFAYLGSGSNEWSNAPRAILTIRNVGSDSVYELRAAKRGKRIGWQDEDGLPMFVRYIAHHGDPGVICWRDARPDEIPADDPGKGKVSLEQKIANLWTTPEEQLSKDDFMARAASQGVSQTAYYRWWKEGVKRQVFRMTGQGMAKLSGKFAPEIAVEDGGN